MKKTNQKKITRGTVNSCWIANIIQLLNCVNQIYTKMPKWTDSAFPKCTIPKQQELVKPQLPVILEINKSKKCIQGKQECTTGNLEKSATENQLM